MILHRPVDLARLKRCYVHRAIAEYEYSFAPEYSKRHLSHAISQGAVDFDPDEPDSHVQTILMEYGDYSRIRFEARELKLVPELVLPEEELRWVDVFRIAHR
jgi:hypothetical protein